MTPTIKNIVTIIALCLQLSTIAQTNSHPKKVIQSVNDTIRNIAAFSPDSLLIFTKEIQYWKDKSEHIFIDGYVYEEKRVIYEYCATEYFLRLIRYEYDPITGLKDQFVKYTKEKTVNNDLMRSIENRNQLIALVESVIPKNSELTNILDSNESHTLVKKGREEVYTRYEDNVESVRVRKKYDKRGNMIFLEERNQWQTTITRYKFNMKGQLVKRTHGFDDYLSKTTYLYENDLLLKTETNLKDGRTNSIDYFYSNGVLVKEVVNKQEGKIIYEYNYEYY